MADTQSPTVSKLDFTSIKTTCDSITVTWEKATDNVTPDDKIIYRIYIKENNTDENSRCILLGPNITSYSFRELKPDTEYLVHVIASDEAGNFIRYPAQNASKRIKTAIFDKEPPKVSTTSFKTIESTSDSITVTWEKATDNITAAEKIVYTVYIKENISTEVSRLVHTAKNLTSYTFTGLKADTEYLVHVFADDEAGNFIRYPAKNASRRIKTMPVDKEAPTVKSTSFTKIESTSDSITVTWEKATDNVTPADKIMYNVYIKENNTSETSRLVQSATNISTYTFTGLKADTEYLVHVFARDAANNYIRYPAKNASMRIRTKVYDNEAPKVQSTDFKTIMVDRESISVTWEKATDNVTAADKIVYSVYIKEDIASETSRLIHSDKNLTSYTFKGLKAGTNYLVHVIATDEAGNFIRYPAKNASKRIRTSDPDKEAPTVTSRAFKVSNVMDDRFTIQWEKAYDKITPSSKILYKVGLTESYNPQDPWRIVKEAPGITSYTFTGLKPNTSYAYYVKAYDEAGNMLQYPADNSSSIVKTKSRRVHSISFQIEQKATVLYGTNTISFGIEYTYYQVNSRGDIIGHGSGAWEHKWSNKSSKSGTITLPEGCYFDDNQVFIRIRSRKAASAGLNTWKACSSGYVDVTSGILKFRLTGSYFNYSVRLGGSPEDGYAQFK